MVVSARKTKKTSTAVSKESEPVVEKTVVSEKEVSENSEPAVLEEGGGKQKDEEVNNPVSVYVSKLNNYVERIAVMNKELKELVNVGKSLEKDFNNIVKVMSKKSKNKSSEKRHPSGFAVPYTLSDELYTFLNIKDGEKVPRNDVTRMINEYITSNSLRDTKDKRIIKPNAELHKIFKSTPNDSITYFNLQSYIKHHFIKEKV
jgi:chromatin remodeling complex protein RSC6